MKSAARPQATTASRGATRRRKPASDTGPAISPLSVLSERVFQVEVVRALRSRGWIVWTVPNMRMTTAGLPDILAIHAGRPVLLALELKTETGRVQPIQRTVISVMQGIPGVEARIVRPSEWPALVAEIEGGEEQGA